VKTFFYEFNLHPNNVREKTKEEAETLVKLMWKKMPKKNQPWRNNGFNSNNSYRPSVSEEKRQKFRHLFDDSEDESVEANPEATHPLPNGATMAPLNLPSHAAMAHTNPSTQNNQNVHSQVHASQPHPQVHNPPQQAPITSYLSQSSLSHIPQMSPSHAPLYAPQAMADAGMSASPAKPPAKKSTGRTSGAKNNA
jgi:hypothetical protein